jgi:phosphodiesterase/alkaline phosphatase D-like protein
MPMNRRTACLLLASGPTIAADLLSGRFSEPVRNWIGPDFWSNPLQDWQYRNNRMECVVSGGDRHVYLLTRELAARTGRASLRVELGRLQEDVEDLAALSAGFAGFRIGIRGTFQDYRDSAVYGTGLNAGISSEGRLFIGAGGAVSEPVAGFPRAVELRLDLEPADRGYTLRLSALDEQGHALASTARHAVDAAAVQGGCAIVCSAGPLTVSQDASAIEVTSSGLLMPGRGREGNFRFWFRDLVIAGDKVDEFPDRAFGPILWSMYTVSDNVLKMTAQMAPVGERAEPVHLEIERGSRWHRIASARIDPLSRTATFRVPGWPANQDSAYRVVYKMDHDAVFTGVVRRDPIDKNEIRVAVLSCLNDFGFPHTELLAAVQQRRPDLLAFEGDQIYERAGSFGIERFPLERATLDYLRKWFLFGWAFRDLLRETPSICMPDDHDVFHGNVWGAGGKAADGVGQPGQDSGGYVEPAAWVNMVQRTQTSHLPDPFDPTPVQQGIGVYYTSLRWGGVSFAILEDRKWKSAPKVMLPAARIVNGWAQNPDYDAATEGDAPGAQLLGPRQIDFLNQWARDWRGGVWMKAVLSQTLLANVATLPPPANTDAVVPRLPIPGAGEYVEGDRLVADHDSNSWPQSGRNDALRAFRRCSAVHLCGDQHLASTVQYGVDTWNDAAFALCSPAMSNVFPRRWFPPHAGKDALPYSPRNTGQYTDGFGNKITVHAVFNPRQSGAAANPLLDRSPGIAIADFHRDTRAITLTVCPRGGAAGNAGARPVEGWPVRIHQLDNGWSGARWRLPAVSAGGRKDFCVEVAREPGREVLYTLRVQGDSFAAPVDQAGTYTVRVFDPDGAFEHRHIALEAQPRQA